MTLKQFQQQLEEHLTAHSIDVNAQPVHLDRVYLHRDSRKLNVQVNHKEMPTRVHVVVEGLE
jgi:hypothetical protein